jgi:uncharacterized membrane protein (UPF0127 family)
MKKKLNLYTIVISVIILLILLLAGLLLFFNPSGTHSKRKVIQEESQEVPPKPVFRKDGEVRFMDADGNRLKLKIDVEVADNDDKRAQGLMYRDSMPEMSGMLFLFAAEEPQAFWMKNTHLSLDIIYVNADRRIVSIARNTKPYSLESIPSGKPAQYVVEVNAGFSERHQIKEGDLIIF